MCVLTLLMCKMWNTKGMSYLICLEKLKNKEPTERKPKEKDYPDTSAATPYFENTEDMSSKFHLDAGAVG